MGFLRRMGGMFGSTKVLNRGSDHPPEQRAGFLGKLRSRVFGSSGDKLKQAADKWIAGQSERALLGRSPEPVRDEVAESVADIGRKLDDLTGWARGERERISSEFREKWRREQAELLDQQNRKKFGNINVPPGSDLEAFLNGLPIKTPNSSNVNYIAWDYETLDFEVGFLGEGPYASNTKYGLRVYVYHGVDRDEAIEFFSGRDLYKPEENWGNPKGAPPPSPGVLVWERLRDSGKPYNLKYDATLFGGGGLPKWAESVAGIKAHHDEQRGKWPAAGLPDWYT